MAPPPTTTEKSQATARAESSSTHSSGLNSTDTHPDRPKEHGDVEELGLVGNGEAPSVPISGDISTLDPFGDESEGGIKYKTLKWWYVQP